MNLYPTRLRIGWGHENITPNEPVLLRGYFNARVSEGVKDPVTVTALVIESESAGAQHDYAIMVSCDLVKISEDLHEAVGSRFAKVLPELNFDKVIISATHTHTAPETHRAHSSWGSVGVSFEELGVISPDEYVDFCADRIVAAIEDAWNGRRLGGISWALGHAVIARNRLITYEDGKSTMYGKTDTPEFRHIEGYEDHTLDVLYTWSEDRHLTGVLVNVPCPAQADGGFEISADYWHETREALRNRLGGDLFVLGVCGPAGDQSPRPLVRTRAEERMLRLKGETQRQQIARVIADVVEDNVALMKAHIEWTVPFAHEVTKVELTRRKLTEDDVKEAAARVKAERQRYETLKEALDNDPSLRSKPRWYTEVTRAHAMMRRHERVLERYELEKTQPTYPAEIHVIRLGDLALATNPFELYVDYGMQIQGRSPAEHTVLIQLSGPGTGNFYIPTERSIAHGGYGAVPASTIVGPEGGRELVEHTVAMLNQLWTGGDE